MDKSLSGKLLAFQKEVSVIKKDMENPYFKSQYFDVNKVIEVIRPILNKVGLVVLQPLTIVENRPAIKTIVIDAETGAEFTDTTFITELPKAQEMGSSTTYFRRYALVSTLLLQGEQDDDGNIASQPKIKQEYRPTPPKTKTIQNPLNDLPFV